MSHPRDAAPSHNTTEELIATGEWRNRQTLRIQNPVSTTGREGSSPSSPTTQLQSCCSNSLLETTSFQATRNVLEWHSTPSFLPKWRNWQTRTIQGRVSHHTRVGSTPTFGTNHPASTLLSCPCSSAWSEQLTLNQTVAGSNPAGGTRTHHNQSTHVYPTLPQRQLATLTPQWGSNRNGSPQTHRPRQQAVRSLHSEIAQLAERLAVNRKAAGSSPALGASTRDTQYQCWNGLIIRLRVWVQFPLPLPTNPRCGFWLV